MSSPYTQPTRDGYAVILDRRRARCPKCGEAGFDRLRCIQGGEYPLPAARLLTRIGGAARDPPDTDTVFRAIGDCIGKVTIEHAHGVCRACGETWLERIG